MILAPDTAWMANFSGLSRLDEVSLRELGANARRLALPAGARLFGPGQAPHSFLLLLAGVMRVQQTSANGRDIVLYRVMPGESCALTTACLLAYEEYQAEAIAETAVDVMALPRATFDVLIAGSAIFRQFVFTAFSRRITGLLSIIEDVAFGRLDLRLAQRLLDLAGPDQHVAATHQDLAAELGTAREVVSRILHEFQRRGMINVSRGSITILQARELRAMAGAG